MSTNPYQKYSEEQKLSSDKCPVASFRIGDLVVERYAPARKAIALKVIGIHRPVKDGRGRYWGECSYDLESYFPEHGGEWVSSSTVPIPESLLVPYAERQTEMIGALLSKVQDLRDLTPKTRKRVLSWDT